MMQVSENLRSIRDIETLQSLQETITALLVFILTADITHITDGFVCTSNTICR